MCRRGEEILRKKKRGRKMASVERGREKDKDDRAFFLLTYDVRSLPIAN